MCFKAHGNESFWDSSWVLLRGWVPKPTKSLKNVSFVTLTCQIFEPFSYKQLWMYFGNQIRIFHWRGREVYLYLKGLYITVSARGRWLKMHGEICVEKSIYIYYIYKYSLVHNCLAISVCRVGLLWNIVLWLNNMLNWQAWSWTSGQCAWPRSVGTWVVSPKKTKSIGGWSIYNNPKRT